MFWTDHSARIFVSANFPKILQAYDRLESNIQRADLIRYLVLYKIGGVYIDLDFECFKNLEGLLKNEICVFSIEPAQHCDMHNKENLVCNAFMASVPDHPFMKLLSEESIVPLPDSGDLNSNVMNSTGPFMVTRVYEKHKSALDVTMLDPKYVYPLTRIEIGAMLHGNHTVELEEKLEDAFAVHYWMNSWVIKPHL